MSALQCLRVSRAASRTLSAVSRRAYSAAADAAPVDEPLVPGPSKTLGDSKSSIAAGTKLFNINYFKNKADPVALEDSEYPAWLWTVLDSGKKNTKGAEDVGDLYCMYPRGIVQDCRLETPGTLLEHLWMVGTPPYPSSGVL
jgi:hypothetical protein